MKFADSQFAPAFSWVPVTVLFVSCFAYIKDADAAGTAVGTVIENTADISYDLAGTPLTLQSNTTTIVVAERIDVTATLQSPQTLVSANDTDQALLFTVTNTGNGTETFLLTVDSNIAGDDFDPVPSVNSIYFDTDGSGDFSVGDQAYTQGSNDPVLVADESVSVLILNDIPGTVVNGNVGRSQIIATSATGTDVPGTVFANQGDGGVDAVIGTTSGTAFDVGEYLVSDVLINVIKTQSIADPFGGTEPIPGATLTYTIAVDVASSGIASASVLRDVVPTFSTFVPGSITLNGGAISDAIDGDAGELDSGGSPTVVIRLGDLTQADGIQTVVFEVTID